jgi:hypothetical protein
MGFNVLAQFGSLPFIIFATSTPLVGIGFLVYLIGIQRLSRPLITDVSTSIGEPSFRMFSKGVSILSK